MIFKFSNRNLQDQPGSFLFISILSETIKSQLMAIFCENLEFPIWCGGLSIGKVEEKVK